MERVVDYPINTHVLIWVCTLDTGVSRDPFATRLQLSTRASSICHQCHVIDSIGAGREMETRSLSVIQKAYNICSGQSFSDIVYFFNSNDAAGSIWQARQEKRLRRDMYIVQ
jgi:hypothetical protein